MTVGVRTEWIAGLVSESQNWSGSIPLSGVRKKDITFLEEENSEEHCIASHIYCFLEEKKQPSRKNQSRMRGAERASGKKLTSPDVSIKCYPTSLHASFSGEGNESMLYTDLCTGKILVMDKCLFFVDKNFHSEKDFLLGFC